eukprot:g3928.t1
MVKDRLEENKRSIAFAKKLQRWADGIGFTFISNMCEDYLAQFTDEKYEVLEGTPIYKLFTGKEQEAVHLGKIIRVNHHIKGELLRFRGMHAFAYIVEGKVALRYNRNPETRSPKDYLIGYFEEGDHIIYNPKNGVFCECAENGTLVLWAPVDDMKRFARRNRRKQADARLPDAMHSLGLVDIESCLMKVPFFRKTVFEINIPEIASLCSLELYAKDDVIVRQGDDIDSFYFCVNGFSKLAVEDDGKENSYKDRTPYEVLSNCVEAPLECMPFGDEDIPEDTQDDEWKFRYQNNTLFGAIERSKMALYGEKKLPSLYSYNTRSNRIPSRIITNHLDTKNFRNSGRTNVFPKHLQELIPGKDDAVLENFKKGNYEGSMLKQGYKKRVITKANKLTNAMIGPGSHFYSIEMIGSSVKKSRFSLMALDWQVYVRLKKNKIEKFLKLPFTRDVNYRYFKNLRVNENRMEETWQRRQRENI